MKAGPDYRIFAKLLHLFQDFGFLRPEFLSFRKFLDDLLPLL